MDLINKLLVVDESKRLTADQALAHPWFKYYGLQDQAKEAASPEPKVSRRVIQRLNSFEGGVQTYKKTALNLLVKNLDDQ